MNRKLTNAMVRELRAIAVDGNPSDPYDWTHAPESLWFHARDKVLGALLSRELIRTDETLAGYVLTDAGEKALREVGESEK